VCLALLILGSLGGVGRSADELPIGVRLERKWRDRVVTATRVEGGWSCEGTIYRTLSAAAKNISGTHCSGPAWFGVWTPKEKRQ